MVEARLHTELWTSWASLLRSYAGAHGLNSPHHAVIEVSSDQITARASTHWIRFTHQAVEKSDGAKATFSLQENGTVSIDGKIEEMDMAAERLARELMQ